MDIYLHLKKECHNPVFDYYFFWIAATLLLTIQEVVQFRVTMTTSKQPKQVQKCLTAGQVCIRNADR